MNFKSKPTIIVLTIIVGLLLILYFIFDPATSQFAPKCPFKFLFGYDCPTCGSQRAMHALLHGEFVQALRYNPFILIVLPYTVAVVYSSISEDRFAVWLKRYAQHYITIYAFVVVYMVWWVVRNTPLWPY